MQFVYFASVREAIGRDSEEFELPHDVATVTQCLDWLAESSAQHKTAFADRAKLRFALDQQMVQGDADISGAKELAIFPPVTGG